MKECPYKDTRCSREPEADCIGCLVFGKRFTDKEGYYDPENGIFYEGNHMILKNGCIILAS
jgi:hypothetical protein